jgi:hypothetical protein
MIRRFLVAAGIACVMTVGASTAAAAPCAGFTDVDDTSAFCPNVEWVKNRGITLGCTSSTLYCPNDPVTRLAMAAFLNRLGTALTPAFLSGVSDLPNTTDITPAGGVVACQTADFPVTGFPRSAIIDAWQSLTSPNAGIDVVGTLVVSTNGGTTWAGISNTDKYMTLYPGATPGNDVTFSTGGIASLDVGSTYRFGIQFTRLAGSGSTLAIYCSQRVQVISRNGSSPPLDQSGSPSRR